MSNKEEYHPHVSYKEIFPILQKISIFGGLTKDQLTRVFRLLERSRFQADEVIFKEGEPPSYIYIIQTGQVKIVCGFEETPLELVFFDVGQCFGETSVVGIQPHSATAIAIEETSLIMLSRKSLMSLFTSDKELFSILILNIAREACRRLRKTDQTLLHYAFRQ